jgi:hypothetical protein
VPLFGWVSHHCNNFLQFVEVCQDVIMPYLSPDGHQTCGSVKCSNVEEQNIDHNACETEVMISVVNVLGL